MNELIIEAFFEHQMMDTLNNMPWMMEAFIQYFDVLFELEQKQRQYTIMYIDPMVYI